MGGMVGMAPAVEAASLSDVLKLADSPPLRPSGKNSAGSRLTLYIARVPGSRDIFLTTLKPREKVVTAQDVESSLYYCHLESEQDELFKMDANFPGEGATEPSLQDWDVPLSSPDEPVSYGQFPPVPEHLPPPLPPRRSHELPSGIKRKPVGVHEVVPFSSNNSLTPNTNGNDSSTRSLGPRPLNNRRQSEKAIPLRPTISTRFLGLSTELEKPPELPQQTVCIPSRSPLLNGQRPDWFATAQHPPLPGKENDSSSVSSRRWTVDHSTEPPRSSQSFDDGPWVQLSPSSPTRPAWSPGSMSPSLMRTNSLVSNLTTDPAFRHGTRAFNLILIRRDPGTGAQTNVAKISVPPFHQRTGRTNKALLQIFNTAYEKFRKMRSPSTAELVRCISEDDHCTFSCDLRLATRARTIKSPSAPYFGDVPVNQLMSTVPSQPFSFLSPWNRVCEFFTGVGGRSLKCRHMLSKSSIVGDDTHKMHVVGLSELRFNTPTTKMFTKSAAGSSATSPRRRPSMPHGSVSAPALQKRKSGTAGGANMPPLPPLPAGPHHTGPGFGLGNGPPGTPMGTAPPGPAHAFPGLPASHTRASQDGGGSPSTFSTVGSSGRYNNGNYNNQDGGAGSAAAAAAADQGRRGSQPKATTTDEDDDDDDDWDVEPMDLSLGQERAGGGFKGNKAKLGKLVIQPEGLELLDLLVAANMGVWWSIR